MATKKKVSAVPLLMCGLLCLCVLLAACVDTQPTDPSTHTTQPPEVIYAISVKTVGGLALEDVDYYVFDSVEHNKIIDWGPLESDGMITFTAPRSDEYVLMLKDVPEGYQTQEYYTLTSTKLDIVLNSAVVTGVNATDTVYDMGDVIRDFTITDTDGNTHTISEILKTKEAVVLNFWYVGCDPCKQEFPYLQAAYELYQDNLEVIAMDPAAEDSEADIAQFKEKLGLTFPMAKVDAAWLSAMRVSTYPQTVIIDRYGVICLMETGKVVEEGIFEGAFSYFTSDNYEQKLVDNISQLDTLEYPTGHKRNPMEINGAAGRFQVNVEAEKAFYTKIFKCDGMIFRVEDPEIYVMYGDKRYDPDENGVITFELKTKDANSEAKVEFYNVSAETKTLTVDLTTPPGTVSTPIDMTYGETAVLLEKGRDKGLYYTMTADQTGFIMLAVPNAAAGKDYDIQILNENTMFLTQFSAAYEEDEEGNLVVAIPVTKGDVLSIAFMSLRNESGVYPEMTIQAFVSYSEHGGVGTLEEIPYSLTFKDVEGLPMAGITATFTVNGEAVVLVSDETGLITTMLPEGSYMVQLVFPEGFTADAAQYLLTPDDASKEVTVRLSEEKTISYTIHVQDNDGLPVENVVVTVGTSYAITDENGNAVFVLPVGSHVATIFPPVGYISKEEEYPFGVRPEVTVVLENNQSTSRISYTVTVLDGYGDPYINVVVRLYASDGTATTVVVSENGVATTTLIRGNYTVELLFQQSNMCYEQVGLQLTPEVTSTTIVVAPGVSGRPVKVKPTTSSSTFDAYYVQLGNTFVDVEPLTLTYFLFKPTQTGTYKIYTDRAGALVENWQTLAQTTPIASGVENNVLTLEVTELGQTYVVGIDAAYDINNAIVTVFRVPDCVIEAFPVTPNLPQIPYAPHMPTYAKVNYLDFAGIHAFVMGADGYYHLDTEDGPVVLIDLLSERFGVSIQKMLATGELAWYTYDEDGYPIYKKDYTDCLNAYLAVMEPVHGLYPLTDDLYTVLKEYGDHVGWWDPDSEGYLFGTLTDGLMIPDLAWQFLCCYIYIDPALCEHNLSQWELTADGTAMTRGCPYCRLEQTHIVGGDCSAETAGQWTLSLETASYTTNCTICGQTMNHVIDADCDDTTCDQWTMSADGTSYERICGICYSLYQHAVNTDCGDTTCGAWVLSEDGINYERSCTVCGNLQRHITGTDCSEESYSMWALSADGFYYERVCVICGTSQQHITGTDCVDATYGQWVLSEDGINYERSCTVCGNLQRHITGTDCVDATYGQWVLSEDGINYERSCAICGNTQIHAVDKDCEGHYGQWVLSEDGVNYERNCTICGNSQRHITGTDCVDATYGQWTLSGDGLTATRTCDICGNSQTHAVDTDCEGHYGAWEKSEDGLTAARICAICGNTQTHAVDTDCEAHYGAWEKSEDGMTAARICDICGNTQTHAVDTDCEGHYGEWTNCADGVNQERTCGVCGNKQTQPIAGTEPEIPGEGTENPDSGEET